MRFKQIAEDFYVEEIINLSKLDKTPEDKNYYYFYLTKKNYNQNKAIDIVAKTFNTNPKFVNVAGTKDRTGITKQVISIAKSSRIQLDKNMEFFNNKFEDMNLEYIGEYPFRLNLGDNLGNWFEVVVRDVVEDEVSLSKDRVSDISTKGVMNFYDSQRFGFAGNSHIVGRDLLKGDIEGAFKEIILSMPDNANNEHIEFVEKIRTSWEDIIVGNKEVIDEIVESSPKFLRQELELLKHLRENKRDFSGAIRLLPKKLRTLYIGAYQAYLFNELLRGCDNLPESVELANSEMDSSSFGYEFYVKKLSEDGLELKDFKIPHMPELGVEKAFRDCRVPVWNLELGEFVEDDLNEGKFKVDVSFSLGRGSYATNVLKQLFN